MHALLYILLLYVYWSFVNRYAVLKYNYIARCAMRYTSCTEIL